MNESYPILTITGSDSTGGSGVQADIKIISDLGAYAVSVITSITVQNTLGIQAFYDIPADIVAGQLDAIINDVQPPVVKVGLIRSVSVLDVVVAALVKYRPKYVIYHPVFFSSKGEKLLDDNVIAQVRQRLLPLCTLVINERREQHGASNVYSSAIAVFLSKGESLERAQQLAREYVDTLLLRSEHLRGRSNELYRAFLTEVEKHSKNKSDVAFYADCLNVSSRYLAQVTKRISGKAPKNIIDEHLAKEIGMRLKATKLSIQEVAFEFGFSSQAHFTKFFKKMTGKPPGVFRVENENHY